MSASGKKKKKLPTIPDKYKSDVEVPEEYRCSGPQTVLATLVCHAALDKQYGFLREYVAVLNEMSDEIEDMEEFDINESDDMGLAPIHFAVFMKDLSCVSILIEHGASCNVKDKLGFTPLHYATGRYGNIDIAKHLLEKGKASVHAITKMGVNPLHGAALEGNAECVRLLLQNGADPRAEDENNNAPLDIAKGEETQRLLHKFGRKEDDTRDRLGESCAACGVQSDSLKRCAQCHVTLYCGRECQAKHWKSTHKKTCIGFVIGRPLSSLGAYSATLSHKKRTIYQRGPETKPAKFLSNKQFIVKVQLPLGGSLCEVEEAMVYNEDRSVHGFVSSNTKGYSQLRKKIQQEGLMGVKAFFWAELHPDQDDGTFKVFHGKIAPLQTW